MDTRWQQNTTIQPPNQLSMNDKQSASHPAIQLQSSTVQIKTHVKGIPVFILRVPQRHSAKNTEWPQEQLNEKSREILCLQSIKWNHWVWWSNEWINHFGSRRNVTGHRKCQSYEQDTQFTTTCNKEHHFYTHSTALLTHFTVNEVKAPGGKLINYLPYDISHRSSLKQDKSQCNLHSFRTIIMLINKAHSITTIIKILTSLAEQRQN